MNKCKLLCIDEQKTRAGARGIEQWRPWVFKCICRSSLVTNHFSSRPMDTQFSPGRVALHPLIWPYTHTLCDVRLADKNSHLCLRALQAHAIHNSPFKKVSDLRFKCQVEHNALSHWVIEIYESLFTLSFNKLHYLEGKSPKNCYCFLLSKKNYKWKHDNNKK